MELLILLNILGRISNLLWVEVPTNILEDIMEKLYGLNMPVMVILDIDITITMLLKMILTYMEN